MLKNILFNLNKLGGFEFSTKTTMYFFLITNGHLN